MVSKKDMALEINGFSSMNKWEYENGFYWFSDPTRINKLLAQYELYKSIIDLPGDVLEFGVYKLCSLIRLATYRNLIENDFSRKIIGFDIFGKFPIDNLSLESDKNFVSIFEAQGGDGIRFDEAQSIILNKGFKNLEPWSGMFLIPCLSS